MTRGLHAAVLAAGFLAAVAHPASAQWEGLKARMALVTNSALTIGAVPAGAEVVATRDCDIEAGEVAQFDALLSLSQSEQDTSKVLHGKWGLPVPTRQIPDEQLLVHREYVINYNRDLKIPVYATYVLKAGDVVPATRKSASAKTSALTRRPGRYWPTMSSRSLTAATSCRAPT